jgi:hypothetical protein
LKGFEVGGELRRRFGQVSSFGELDDLLALLPADQPYPDGVAAAPRGRTTGSPRRVALPDRWLQDRDDLGVPVDTELMAVSGG